MICVYYLINLINGKDKKESCEIIMEKIKKIITKIRLL